MAETNYLFTNQEFDSDTIVTGPIKALGSLFKSGYESAVDLYQTGYEGVKQGWNNDMDRFGQVLSKMSNEDIGIMVGYGHL